MTWWQRGPYDRSKKFMSWTYKDQNPVVDSRYIDKTKIEFYLNKNSRNLEMSL